MLVPMSLIARIAAFVSPVKSWSAPSRSPLVTKLLTAQVPAIDATIPPDITIGRTPRVILKIMPLIPPAATLLNESCLPRQYPIVLLMPLYIIATTPAELPRKGPLLVIALSAEFSRSFGGAVGGSRFSPSMRPHVPPIPRALRYVTPVP